MSQLATSSKSSPLSLTTFWAYFHIVLSGLAAVVLIALIWLWHPAKEPPKSPEAAAYHVFFMSMATMAYLAAQAYATLHQPVGAERRVLSDILVSALPLLVIVYAVLDYARGNLQLNVFQMMTVWQWAVATLIDVVIYSSFSLRIIRRSSEVNVAR